MSSSPSLPSSSPSRSRPPRMSRTAAAQAGRRPPQTSPATTTESASAGGLEQTDGENVSPIAVNAAASAPNAPNAPNATNEPSHTAAEPRTRSKSTTVLRVVPLVEAMPEEPVKRGRREKLKMPPLPKALVDAMTPLEQEHFFFFIQAHIQDYNLSKPTDLLALHHAAFDHINLLRVQVLQLSTGEIFTAARQHPGIQLRAWLDSLSTTRKARKEQTTSAEDEQMEAWKAGLQKLSS